MSLPNHLMQYASDFNTSSISMASTARPMHSSTAEIATAWRDHRRERARDIITHLGNVTGIDVRNLVTNHQLVGCIEGEIELHSAYVMKSASSVDPHRVMADYMVQQEKLIEAEAASASFRQLKADHAEALKQSDAQMNELKNAQHELSMMDRSLSQSAEMLKMLRETHDILRANNERLQAEIDRLKQEHEQIVQALNDDFKALIRAKQSWKHVQPSPMNAAPAL
eukprot:Clim_evm16s47 gene=Clim_evmTU16s47